MESIPSKDETTIACWQSGAGQPLVLVHGTSGDHLSWTPVLSKLEAHFSVYNLDRRGRGQSGDAKKYTIAREAEDIASVIESIGGKVNVFGHSFGGLCALEAALLTDNIAQLMLYEPPLSLSGTIWSDELNTQMQQCLANGKLEDVLLIFYRDILKTSSLEIIAMQSSQNWPNRVAEAHTIQRELQSLSCYQFQAERFKSLQAPTTLFLGSESPPRRHVIANTLKQALPNSQIVRLEGQGHSAIRTAPELLVQEIIKNFTTPLD